MSLFGSGDQQTAQTQPVGAFSFGAATSTAPTNLTAQAGATTNLLGGTNTGFGGFGTATSTTSSLFGTTQTAPTFSSSLFSSSTTTSSAFPTFGQTTTTPAGGGFSFGGSALGQTATTSTGGGFSFGAPTLGQTSTTALTGGFSTGAGGFGNPVTSNSTFGIGSLAPVSSTVPSTSTATIGLGGVDIQSSSGLSGSNTPNKKDGKAVKELQVPNEISVTVESFKKYVKQQKAIREEMSRVSSKNIFKVQELVGTLKQQLSIVSNGLQRNAKAIVKLKEESNQELKNAEIAQRTKDALTAMQYENNAPTEYFHNLANSFEKQMQSYRQQIEQLERHLMSLSLPYTLTPNEWTAIRKKLHDTFVTLAAHLQTIHQEVQLCKEHFITQRTNQDDMRIFMEKHKENMKSCAANTHLPASVTYGPSPFAAMQSAVGKAITNVFNRSQQLPGATSPHMMLSLSSTRFSSFQSNPSYKPLGQSGVPSFGSSSLSDTTGFGSEATSSQFALNNQKPFQLQKPPAGNKRGKRWTST